MGKIKKCVGKESFLRMNYLYQLSNFILENKTLAVASNMYTSLMMGISRKSVQRIGTNIKRTICKRCHQYLVPGDTCKVRIKKKFVVYTCNTCNFFKSYKLDKNYQLWSENPEALFELLDYSKEET